MDNNRLSWNKIRGWLLVYVIWAFWGAAFSIYSNATGVFVLREILPEMVKCAIGILILVLIFYGYYIFLLVQLLRKEQGIIAKIKWMILSAPVFNAALPAISSFCIKAVLGSANLGEILRESYNATVLGSLFGAAVMAFIWYRYFIVSKRVKAIWPNG